MVFWKGFYNQMIKGMNILYICEYAAPYPGSFVPALSALIQEVGKNNTVYCLFPEKANNMPWLSLLGIGKDHIFYADFSVKKLAQKCQWLCKMLGRENTIVHTHFVGDFRLAAVRFSFPKVICHYHMMVPYGTTLMKKLFGSPYIGTALLWVSVRRLRKTHSGISGM